MSVSSCLHFSHRRTATFVLKNEFTVLHCGTSLVQLCCHHVRITFHLLLLFDTQWFCLQNVVHLVFHSPLRIHSDHHGTSVEMF